MSAEKFYYQYKNNKNTVGFPLIKSLLFSFVLLISLPALAVDVPPVFSNGSPQSLSVCKNSGANDISSLLTINAISPGQSETWSVSMAPVSGSLGGFNETVVTTGSPLTPSGLTYTPATGFTGIDSFTIQVSDGYDSTTTTIYVTVHPLPTLISSLSPSAICSGTAFSYAPESGISGATFAWHRATTSGISTPAASGTGDIDETLTNITYYNISTTYAYTVTANGCHGTADVSVTVKPTPTLNGSLTESVCNDALFDYTVASNTTGTSISWSRAAVAGITPATSAGTGNISETLVNSNASAENVVYTFLLSANGCAATRYLNLTVEPPVPVTAISTKSPSSVCSNTLYQNFGTATPPPSGVTYTWGAINASVFAQGTNNQYILVNFYDAGNALITLTANVPGTSCNSIDSFAVNVGSSVSAASSITYFNSQFIYLDNTDSTYQWGYDNIASLDSTLVPNATFQSYTDSTPDFAANYYWVITTKDGCMEKTYYNSPLAVTNVQNANQGNIKAYPNPSSNVVNVEINGLASAPATVTLSDMLGRTLKSVTGSQQTMQFTVSDLPSGCYLFTCYKNNLKVATTRFIKN